MILEYFSAWVAWHDVMLNHLAQQKQNEQWADANVSQQLASWFSCMSPWFNAFMANNTSEKIHLNHVHVKEIYKRCNFYYALII